MNQNSASDIEYNKYIASYRLRYRNKEDVQIFFPLDTWPKHLVRILFKLHISGSTGLPETGHTARFKLIIFLFCNGLRDPIAYIKIFHPALIKNYVDELAYSLEYIKTILSTKGAL